MDEAYCQALLDLPDDQTVKDAWEIEDTRLEKYQIGLLARLMEEGQYPGLLFASNLKLNDTGTKFYSYSVLDCLTRYKMAEKMEISGDMGQTFRDDVQVINDIHSLHTGTPARPLKKQWMDIVGSCSIENGDI